MSCKLINICDHLSFLIQIKATDAKLSIDTDLQVDEEDAWIVENHQLQNWDPVSIQK